MSTNLYWRMAPLYVKGHCLGKELKYCLGPKFWEHDGTLHGDPLTVGRSLIPYLEGIMDGADKGSELYKAAKELKEAIEKYDIVEISIEG